MDVRIRETEFRPEGFRRSRADKHVNRDLVRRSKEAIMHRVRNLMAKIIRESLGAR